MSNENEILIVLGSKRYAASTDKDVWIQPPLIGDRRTMVEGDRSITVNQEELFNKERQESGTIRVSGKILLLIHHLTHQCCGKVIRNLKSLRSLENKELSDTSRLLQKVQQHIIGRFIYHMGLVVTPNMQWHIRVNNLTLQIILLRPMEYHLLLIPHHLMVNL